jgi:hypothetical protein
MMSLISSPRSDRSLVDDSIGVTFLDTARSGHASLEEIDLRSVILCDNDAYFAHPLPYILTTEDLDGPGRGAD